MDITISVIGTLRKPAPEFSLYERYVKRIPWKVRLHSHKPQDVVPVARRLQKEAALLSKPLSNQYPFIALDEGGKSYSSGAFAQLLQRYQEAQGGVSFVIGGAYGLDPNLKQQADQLLALGPMTWPHELALVLLIEQIYRGYTIHSNHPYHKI